MNKIVLTIKTALIVAMLSGVGCSLKTRTRNEHEKAKVWTPKDETGEVRALAKEIEALDLAPFYDALKHKKNLMVEVIGPLSTYVLNSEVIESQANRSIKLIEISSLFSEALYYLEKNKNSHSQLAEIREKYIQTIFSGCVEDLRADDCTNIRIFSGDRFATRNLLLFAIERDPQIVELLKSTGSNADCISQSKVCAELVESRYRLIGMAFLLKKNRNLDSELMFAFLRYSRLLAVWFESTDKSIGYLREVHGSAFEMMISQYSPLDPNSEVFKDFVNNFNPWFYSNRKSDLFRYGTRVMFDLAAKCCLYQDGEKSKAASAVFEAIDQLQNSKDEYGSSFFQIVKSLETTGGREFFAAAGLAKEWENIKDLKSPFYDEIFYIFDRLFRGHINSSEAQMLLKNAKFSRVNIRANNVIQTFMRVYLAYMIVETNKFMADIYASDQISGSEVFKKALLESREITGRWHDIQNRIDLMNKFAGSYFKTSGSLTEEYRLTDKLAQSVNRNIHYLSVYPNMIVMTYFLVKMQGSFSFDTWWGQKVTIPGDTILDDFFAGKIPAPWFPFGTDPVSLNRQMIFYSFYYALSSRALETFVDGDRSSFITLIFTKYLDSAARNLSNLMDKYQSEYKGRSDYNLAKQVCDYELDQSGKVSAPRLPLNLLQLRRFTFSGMGENGVYGVAGTQLSSVASALEVIRAKDDPKAIADSVDFKLPFIKALVKIVENDLVRQGKIKNFSDSHPDLDSVRSFIRELDKKRDLLVEMFTSEHKYWYACLAKMQNVERYHQNRIYQEERNYLSDVYDLMTEGDGSGDANGKFVINFENKFGVKPRFDNIDGKIFRYSNIDLLMRIKKFVEADIFRIPTDEDKMIYGSEIAHLTRPRVVRIEVPPGIERNEMIEKAKAVSLSLTLGKEEFVRQGMLTLNGNKGASSYLDWLAQEAGDVYLKKYLDNLIHIYLIAGEEQVPLESIVDVYLTMLDTASMDERDVKNAFDMSVNGRKEIKFFEDGLIEKNSHKSLPLFQGLMKSVFRIAGMALSGDGEIGSSVAVAKTLNNLGLFIFEPEPVVKQSLSDTFGGKANITFARVFKFYRHLQSIEKRSDIVSRMDRLGRKTLYVQNGNAYRWDILQGAFDSLENANLEVFLKDYLRQTGDVFATSLAIEKAVGADRGPR